MLTLPSARIGAHRGEQACLLEATNPGGLRIDKALERHRKRLSHSLSLKVFETRVAVLRALTKEEEHIFGWRCSDDENR